MTITYVILAILFGGYIMIESLDYYFGNKFFNISDKIIYFIAIIIFSISVGMIFK